MRIDYGQDGPDDLKAGLEARAAREAETGVTAHGPHRDRIDLLLDGRSLAAFGSSGQVRTALWMVKLAGALLLVEKGAEPPLFLLDDVEAELDEGRVGRMMGLTRERVQLLMTSTRPLTSSAGPLQRFRVESGRVVDGGE